VPAALVWGGHVRYGYWHVAVAHRLDLPSAPTVSCHGEHSPDISASAKLVRREK